MTCSDNTPTIYLLSPFISHYDPLLRKLDEIENLHIRIVNIEALQQFQSLEKCDLILVDARFNDVTLMELQTHPLLQRSQSNALIFAPKQPNLALLSMWTNLSGYFYDTISSEQFRLNVLRLLQGENCLPKSLLLDLFQHWQNLNKHQDHSLLKTRLSLTRRELEILSLMQAHQSNLDIADQLFVSEHTIKSHLYRIFKKLNVSNRRQAINWAQLHL